MKHNNKSPTTTSSSSSSSRRDSNILHRFRLRSNNNNNNNNNNINNNSNSTYNNSQNKDDKMISLPTSKKQKGLKRFMNRKSSSHYNDSTSLNENNNNINNNSSSNISSTNGKPQIDTSESTILQERIVLSEINDHTNRNINIHINNDNNNDNGQLHRRHNHDSIVEDIENVNQKKKRKSLDTKDNDNNNHNSIENNQNHVMMEEWNLITKNRSEMAVACDNYDNNVDKCIDIDHEENEIITKRSKNTNNDSLSDVMLPCQSIEILPNDSSMDVDVTDDSLLSPSYSGIDHSFYFEDDDEADYEFHMNIDDDDDEDGDSDDDSCASTVVNDKPPRLVKPPPTATKEEQARFYWELCYGKDTKNIDLPISSWSASRKPPIKSCLSAKKIPWTEKAESSIKRSTRRINNLNSQKNTPTTFDQYQFDHDDSKSPKIPSPTERSGPKMRDTPNMKTPQSSDCSGVKSVKFGFPSAAEFESTRPTVELTPLPSDKARERFPVEENDDSSDDESAELHKETARNGALLALWEDDFDDYIDDNIEIDDECSDDEESKNMLVSRRGRRSSCSIRSRDRRSSLFYSKNGKSLVESNQLDDKTIIPRTSLQMGSPCTKETFTLTSSHSDESETDSMQYSSPSMNESLRLSTSDSDASKITPNADVQSSSSLLRSVHSEGGASIGRNRRTCDEDTTQELKPSQLDRTLREAEGHFGEKKNISKKKISFIDQIIHDELTGLNYDEVINKIATDQFGLLLSERASYFDSSFDIATSALLNNILNSMNVHSYASIADAIFETIQNASLNKCHTCIYEDVVEVLEMSVSFLEQDILTMNECDLEQTRILSSWLHQTLESSDRTDFYSTIVESAYADWERLETQAFETVLSCFQIIHQTNCEEELKIQETIRLAGSEVIPRTEKIISDFQAQIKNDIEILDNLKKQVLNKESELRTLHQFSSLWAKSVEVEMDCPLVAVDYCLLNLVLTFNQKELMMDKVEISYPHRDVTSNTTIICWSSNNNNELRKKHSFNTSDEMVDLLTTKPSLKHVKNVTSQCDSYCLPEESAAHKICSFVLENDLTKKFINYCFEQEEELGLLTVTDVFQRLDHLAMDVMELHKYYICRVEGSSTSSCLILYVTIALGATTSICIRFTYDLSYDRTILYAIPSEVYVSAIAGEPTVPVNVLLQHAQQYLVNGSSSNAYLLKRTCSVIVDVLQGHDITS